MFFNSRVDEIANSGKLYPGIWTQSNQSWPGGDGGGEVCVYVCMFANTTLNGNS